mmetsp:Transcript_15388/g.39688  ORF Transcript_15388/g.39688 Transcript_15388/m.39688 type:complete len:543 (+) Transcript_15388:96-1724(+)|eukprot:CAMPEP_0182937310 /NCGR_PEP_ID=MMETSP0105_2-20130417/41843_1 /TAXON_ID=81532 ORGANISM="Acanthoeca-like sp., Strain 10tr" /NCGR_SAMPLE_ID=MMETSP0105_2 /ASSEMBLY_ACC=CAM_ASM_000205 /LENGTH=542 /DNA_ID=CAMNT_0025076503 /DNA_START=10 /DNA_END=1638 /DNA_ORIENTATION=+
MAAEGRPAKRLRTAGADAAPFFSLGRDTYRVPMAMHAENRDRLVNAMGSIEADGLVVLKGGEAELRHDTDHERIFRQESYFNWAFGVREPDCFGIIDLKTGEATLLVPRLTDEVEPWVGAVEKPESFQTRYAVDAVKYVDELKDLIADTAMVHVLLGQNSDSGNWATPAVDDAFFAGCAKPPKVETGVLFKVIADLRVFKTKTELALLQHVSNLTSAAHVDVMRNVYPGMGEYQLESLFHHYIYYRGGCRLLAYTCICACGPNAATLHYGHAGAPNDRTLEAKDIALLDMGAEYHCYCSDITCSFPVSGKFDDRQRMVYNGVLNAVRAVEEAMKPGIAWPDMHRLATRSILEHLTKNGLLSGDVDDMVEANLGKVFLPCGLGHFIGLDTHDVGGYLDGYPKRIDEGPYGIKKLRTARVLAEGMVLTVEPGIYFIKSLIDMAQADPALSKFLTPKLDEFRDFGGVRLEDVVAVTADGIDNYTLCPRTIDEIESVMSGGAWPPVVDEAKYLSRRWKATPKRTFSSWADIKGAEKAAASEAAACC